jgi:hypothetical protein
MHFEGGWERNYAEALKKVSSIPLFMVGRITTPDVAERMLAEGVADGIGVARQLFADPDWALKVEEDRVDDIRQCVAANHCWKSVSKGQRVQCVYNPTVGREARWGKGTLAEAAPSKTILVIGGGPAGLECARIAGARGHRVTVLEREQEPGGHVRLQSLLPGRARFGEIGTWLVNQARKAGASIRLGESVDEANLAAVCSEVAADHVVVATGARVCKDGFQGWTADSLSGVETQRVFGWDEVLTGAELPEGDILVLDDQADLIGPLIAVQIANQAGRRVRLVTRWPMVGMETIADAYFEWIMPQVYESGVQVMVDHFVRSMRLGVVQLYNIFTPTQVTEVAADAVVFATARQSRNELAQAAQELGIAHTLIGDAVAPRATFEAVFEGHRMGRAL